ncbi:hypothetical protein K431DRAFT_244405, partial [Polychaeton citri CBS 116435]
MAQAVSIDRLLNLVPDSPGQVINYLQSHPDLASKQDSHGYSLVHAATSYNQIELLRTLIQQFNVDPNIADEDDETALFNAENVEVARELLDLGARLDARNSDGQTAAEKLDDEDEAPSVAEFLRTASSSTTGAAAETNGVLRPPSLPDGVQVNVGTMDPGEEGEAPDPEFRRRIEELAAREDFHGEEGQRELRSLIEDAMRGVSSEAPGQGRAQRR